MNKAEKGLVLNSIAYPESPSYWGIKNVKEYLRKLAEGNNEVAITSTPIELRTRLIPWVESSDPKLDYFYKKNKVIEQEKSKVVQLFEIPSSLKSNVEQIVKKGIVIAYDPFGVGTWDNPKMVFANKKLNEYQIWYSVKASKHASKGLDASKLPTEVRETLVTALKSTVPEMDSLEKIRLEYSIVDRIINIIVIDLDKKVISISTDQPKFVDPDDTEQSVIRPEDRLAPIFERVLESFGMKKSETNRIIEKKKINKASLKKITATENKSILLLPFRYDIGFPAGDLSALTMTRFIKITTTRVLPIVKDYFESKNTFTGFLAANPNLDAQKKSIVLQTITNLSGAEDEAQGFFLFLVINSEIEVARVVCNVTTGSLRVFLDKGRGAYERINEELDKLFP